MTIKVLDTFRPEPPIVLLAIGQTLVWAGLYYIFPALLLQWEQALGWSKSDITAAITLAVLISGACSPFTGRIIDKGHGPALMALSAIIGGIGLLLLSRVTSLWQFYFVWGLIGTTLAGCLYEPCFAIVTRAKGQDAKRGIIFITLIAGFASTISFPLVYSLAAAYGWRVTTSLSGIMIITIVAPLLFFAARELQSKSTVIVQADTNTPESRNDFLKTRTFWFLAVGFSFMAIVHGATIHHLLPLLDERGLPAQLAVLIASFVGPMQVAGRLVMMTCEQYVSLHAISLAAFVLMTSSAVVLLFSGTSMIFLFGFVLVFGGAYGTMSILRPLVARHVLGEHQFGAKSGALALPYLFGSASAPYLASIIWALGGYSLVLIAIFIIGSAGCVLYLLAQRAAKLNSNGQT